jgi:hypothetical protein
MTKTSVFDCDVCGDRYGHKTSLMAFDVHLVSDHKPQIVREFEEPSVLDVHVCLDEVPDGAWHVLRRIRDRGYVAVSNYDGTVEAIVEKKPDGDIHEITKRDELPEELIEFIEEDVYL